MVWPLFAAATVLSTRFYERKVIALITRNDVEKAFREVVEHVNAELNFSVECSVQSVDEVIVSTVWQIDGRELSFNMRPTSDSRIVARALATHMKYMSGEVKNIIDVPDLWNTWWQNCTANNDIFQTWWNTEATKYGVEFEAEPIQQMLEEVQGHVLAAVESDAEYSNDLLWLAEILERYGAA